MRRASWALLRATSKEDTVNRSAIAAFFAALIAALVALLLTPKIPEAGGILTTIAWIVCAGLILYGLYLLVVGRPGTRI